MGTPMGSPRVSPMLCPAALRFHPTKQEEVEGRRSGEGVGRWGMKQSKPASMEIKLIRTPGRGKERGGGGKQLQSKDRINICAEAFSFQVLLRWGCSVGGAELRMRAAAVGWAWGGSALSGGQGKLQAAPAGAGHGLILRQREDLFPDTCGSPPPSVCCTCKGWGAGREDSPPATTGPWFGDLSQLSPNWVWLQGHQNSDTFHPHVTKRLTSSSGQIHGAQMLLEQPRSRHRSSRSSGGGAAVQRAAAILRALPTLLAGPGREHRVPVPLVAGNKQVG